MIAVNQIYQRDVNTLLDQLADQIVDALITDPPYSTGGTLTASRKRDPKVKYQNTEVRELYPTFSGDMRDQRTHQLWLVHWLSKAWPKLKDGAIVGLFSDWRQWPVTSDALQIAGFTWLGVVTWDKTEACRPQKDRFRNQAEYCLLARKITFAPVNNPPRYLLWGCKGLLPNDRGVGILPGVFRHYLQPSEKQHMTAKPLSLMRELVKIVTPGGLIVDPFAGSGTTLAAAKLEGYQFIGGELLPEHVATAKARLTDLPATNNAEALPLF